MTPIRFQRLAALALALLAGAVPAAGAAGMPDVSLSLPPSAKVAFFGAINSDQAGQAGAMLYPAPGLIGFLAAVATHGVLNSASNSAAAEKRRTQADLVLLPYQSVLDSFTPEQLHAATLQRLRQQSTPVEIDSAPAFVMTQDQSALVLDNTLEIRVPGALKPYRQTVIVVLPAAPADSAPAYWSDAGGKALKEASARLLATSIEVALADMQSGPQAEGKHKTVRYMEGQKEKVERAELLRETCDSVVLRTLRGNLMHVPRKEPTACS